MERIRTLAAAAYPAASGSAVGLLFIRFAVVPVSVAALLLAAAVAAQAQPLFRQPVRPWLVAARPTVEVFANAHPAAVGAAAGTLIWLAFTGSSPAALAALTLLAVALPATFLAWRSQVRGGADL